MSTDITQFAVPDGPGSVASAPNLPAGFTDTFSSRIVDTDGLRQHVVVGGDGPPLLLVHGWPENWYAWRFVMPTLAADFTVVAVDQRGIGLTDKPETGYDSGTLAGDLIALMDALGHDRFAVVGHDIGIVISYALAADHPDRVAYLSPVEVPGPPTPYHSPPLFVARRRQQQAVAHRLQPGRQRSPNSWSRPRGLLLRLRVRHPRRHRLGRGRHRLLRRPSPTPESLRGSFAFYREWDTTMAQNAERAKQTLQMPVLAIGGAPSWGDHVGDGDAGDRGRRADRGVPGAGHWVADRRPRSSSTVLGEFLAPYRAA